MGLRRTYILVLAWVANTEPRNTQLQRDRSPDCHVIQQMAGQSNPWTETDLLTGIKLGCPENGLVMARQFSLQRVGSNDVRTLHLSVAAFLSLFLNCSLRYLGVGPPSPTTLCPGTWKQSGKPLICGMP